MNTSWAYKRAELSPGITAIIDGDSQRAYSFAAMAERCGRLCTALAAWHVGNGDRVAVLAKNHLAHVDLWLASGHSGLIAVPLNWRLSLPELALQCQLAKPVVLFYGAGFEETAQKLLASGLVGHVVPLAEYENLLAGASEAAPHPAGARDVAMLLFTGGTTGTPKAVAISHRQILYNALNTQVSWDLDAQDRSAVCTPFFHTGGYHVLMTPLYYLGGTSVLFANFVPEQILSSIHRDRESILFMVPAMFDALAASPQFDSTDWSSVRFAISGGAPCPATVTEKYRGKGPDFRQGYGLTEVGPNCFATPRGQTLEQDSVGVPVFHLTARIVSPTGTDVPAGIPGELWLKGPTVANGYYGNPEESARDFDSDGFFHTGDIAVRDSAGHYKIIGRMKEMYISGGENVYPAEVEQALLSLPGIAGAAVVAAQDPRWGEVGVAFVVGQLKPEEVRAQLRGILSSYKIPKTVHAIKDLPLTPAGKPDKAKLRQWVAGEGSSYSTTDSPSSTRRSPT